MLVALVAMCALSAAASPIGTEDANTVKGIGSYYINSVMVTWEEGYADCASRNHKMVVLDGEGESTKLDEYMVTTGLVNIHMGFHDKVTEGVYQTITGGVIEATPCGVSPWEDGYPTNTLANNCGGYSNLGYRDTNCTELRVTVCEIDERRDYTAVGAFGLYKYHDVPATWGQASDKCTSEGAHLVVINSAEEANALAANFPYIGDYFWVGVHRLYGPPVTVLDEPLSTTGFEEWTAGHPVDPSADFPYVAVNFKYFNAPTLSTLAKASSKRYFCEL